MDEDIDEDLELRTQLHQLAPAFDAWWTDEMNQSSEDLRGHRDQWLLQKQNQEQEYHSEMAAADTQHEFERQDREDRLMAT